MKKKEKNHTRLLSMIIDYSYCYRELILLLLLL